MSSVRRRSLLTDDATHVLEDSDDVGACASVSLYSLYTRTSEHNLSAMNRQFCGLHKPDFDVIDQ